jgi:hypothetical protein
MLAIYIINKNVEIYAGGGEDMRDCCNWKFLEFIHRNRKIARDDTM